MSEVLTVPTAFGDISDLTSGLIDRVDGDQIILYGPTPYEEGAEIDFSVLLVDGTPALEGRGRVAASVDGGEDRDASIRYDVFLDSLQLGGVAEAVYESILMERSARGEADAGEAYAEQATDDVAFEDGGEEPAVEEAAAEYAPEEAFAEDAPAAEEVAAEAEDVPAEDAFAAEEAFAAEDAPAEEAFAAEDAPAEEALAAEDAPAEEALAAEDAPAEEALAAEDAPAEEPAAEDAEDWRAGSFDDEATVVDELHTEEAAAGVDADGFGDDAFDEGEGALDAEEAAAPVAPAIAIPTELFPADDEFKGAAPPAAPADPGGFGVTNDLTEGLVRPVQQNTWTPVAPPRPEPRPSSGLFQYGATVPMPAAPPRPELDPALVVTRAPHPRDAEPQAEVDSVEPELEAPAYEESAELEVESDGEGELVEPAVESGEYEAAGVGDAEAVEVEQDLDQELEPELEASSERD